MSQEDRDKAQKICEDALLVFCDIVDICRENKEYQEDMGRRIYKILKNKKYLQK